MFSVIIDVFADLALDGGCLACARGRRGLEAATPGGAAAGGHCVECDYNLRGNESGVCPECGTKIEDEDREGP